MTRPSKAIISRVILAIDHLYRSLSGLKATSGDFRGLDQTIESQT